MTRPSLQNRSILHRKRGIHLGGVGPAPVAPLPVDATPTPPKAIVPAIPPDRPKDTTTATTTAGVADDPLTAIPAPILSRLGLITSTSSDSSTPTVPATPSTSSTSSLPTTHSSIPITTLATPVIVHTSTRLDPLTSTLASTHSPSTTARASGGMSTITLVSGIAGALGATILLTVIVAFFLRRWRKRAAEDAFDPSEFRRSAALLDGDDRGRPRPPSMIERKIVAPIPSASPLSPPSAAYPYSELPTTPFSGNEHAQSYAQHGANTAQYGLQPPSFAVGNGFNGNGGAPNLYQAYPDHGEGNAFVTYAGPGQGHEQYGAPPVPGTYGPGAYASYGDPRYPQSQRYPQYQNQQPQHPQQYQNQQPQQYQPGFGQDTSLNRQGSVSSFANSSLANPFSPLPVLKNLEPIQLESPTSSSASASSNSELTRGPSVLARQTHDAPPAYINDDGYINMKRDVKMLPPPPLSVVNADSAVPNTAAAGTTTTTESNGHAQRPLTVYDDDDAYGGM